jgi:membrane fusion protein (multidrug efflux system)
VLFRIDDRDYRARLAQAEANVDGGAGAASPMSMRRSSSSTLSFAGRAQDGRSAEARDACDEIVGPPRELVRSNAVSQALVDESDAARLRAEARLASASATVEAQQQRIAVLAIPARSSRRRGGAGARPRANSPRSISTAPSCARRSAASSATARSASAGWSRRASHLLDIVPVDDVWVVANFKETQLEQIRPGQRVRISRRRLSDEALAGVVDSFAPGSGSAFSLLPADNATGNFVRVVQRVPVKIRFRQPPLPGRLVPGLSASASTRKGGRAAIPPVGGRS